MKDVTRSDLVNKMAASRPVLSKKDVDASVRIILDAMADHLAKGERVEIRDFGSFCINESPARIGRNPRTGEKVEVPQKRKVYFKAGKEMRERANTLATS